MWLKFLFLQVLFHQSAADEKICGYQNSEWSCVLYCEHGIENITRLERCCTGNSVPCKKTDLKYLRDMKRECLKEEDCSIEKSDVNYDGGNGCHLKIVYNCFSGRSSIVIVSVTSVLGVLVIVIAICGILLYRRRLQKNRNEGSKSNADDRVQGQVNTGLDHEYNTIPADYDVIPDNSYAVLGNAKTGNEHEYSKSAPKDSVRYTTIVLKDDIETEKESYAGYDKTFEKKKFDATKLKDDESTHSYGHLKDTSDDYNKLKATSNKQVIDKDYSHIESDTVDDYSHLNDKDKTPETHNDYNHLQVNSKPIGPVKRVDSYEQPVLKSDINQQNARSTITRDNYEAPVNFPDSKLKRVDSYEQPVLKNTTEVENNFLKVSKSANKTVDSYETPVHFKQPVNVADVNTECLTNNQLKRIDDYEKPVLKGTIEDETDRDNEKGSSNRAFDRYESELTLKETQRPAVDAHDGKLKRVDSYETPVLKTLDSKLTKL